MTMPSVCSTYCLTLSVSVSESLSTLPLYVRMGSYHIKLQAHLVLILDFSGRCLQNCKYKPPTEPPLYVERHCRSMFQVGVSHSYINSDADLYPCTVQPAPVAVDRNLVQSHYEATSLIHIIHSALFLYSQCGVYTMCKE
jgi:hypothetical protein